MLTIIEGLPDHVIGIRITEKLRADDYKQVLIPLIDERLDKHRKLDFLCCIDGEWKGMEASAAWQDLQLGLGKMGRWARMAVVTDIKWLENAIKLFRLLSPSELRHFGSDDYEAAKTWVCETARAQIHITMDANSSILTLEPGTDAALSEYDFAAVGEAIRDYLTHHARLRGIFIHSRSFPGWQNIGALFAHLKFVSSVHDKIDKVAIATNSPMGTFADKVLDPLMLAKVRRFDYDQRDEAMAWLQD